MLPKTTAHTLTDQTLAHVPLSMAEAVKPAIAFADRAGYARFLSAMVAYTRGSGERLEHAARVSPEGPLRAFFSRLAHEEAGHYKLAEADLAAMGLDPDATPNETVLAFHRGWMSQRAPAYFLGTLYALESVAWHLRDDVGPHLARLGLAREMCRFVSVHLQADEAHGADTAALVEAHGEAEAVRAAALDAATFWVMLHLDALVGL